MDLIWFLWFFLLIFWQLGTGYSGGSVGGPDVSQHSVASRHSAILGGSQELDVGGYRAHSSTSTQYGGQYSSVYGSAALSSAQQVSGLWIIVIKLCFHLTHQKFPNYNFIFILIGYTCNQG